MTVFQHKIDNRFGPGQARCQRTSVGYSGRAQRDDSGYRTGGYSPDLVPRVYGTGT